MVPLLTLILFSGGALNRAAAPYELDGVTVFFYPALLSGCVMATRQTQVQKKKLNGRGSTVLRVSSQSKLACTRTHSHGCILITFTHLFTTTAPTHGSCRSCRDEPAAFPRFDTFPLIPPQKNKVPTAAVGAARTRCIFFFFHIFFSVTHEMM